ncbi:hypothetical protein PGH46_15785 [Legionella pneumophila]|nr:hypothetical protein [Legionella pneumophila]MDW9146911.1 hypothetical protein [Legionella pneumophila]MDW9164060.1 hypothetical protein [Legionella pneumophila]MDW9188189.1 hypothetical protein [Legionella pneumophila]WBV68389.1 hypothetical protein PGH46_15785 [Legionella pneumophila]
MQQIALEDEFFLINTIILAVSNGTTCDGMVLQFKIPLHLGESSILSL